MINRLERYDLNCSVFNSYDYDDCLSLNELLCRFFTKINECIEASNKALSFTEWLKEIGLSLEVAKLLDEWLNDGTLENLINERILTEIKLKVEKLEAEVNKKLYSKNILDYGCVGDGLTDNYMAFSELFNNLKDGDTVFIPNGTFLIELSDTILIDEPEFNRKKTYFGYIINNISNLTIRGDGILKIKSVNTTKKSGVACFKDCLNLNIDGVKVEGDVIFNDNEILKDKSLNGFSFVRCNNLKITKSYFSNLMATLEFTGTLTTPNDGRLLAENILVTNNIFKDYGQITTFGGGVSGLTFNNNICINPIQAGIKISSNINKVCYINNSTNILICNNIIKWDENSSFPFIEWAPNKKYCPVGVMLEAHTNNIKIDSNIIDYGTCNISVDNPITDYSPIFLLGNSVEGVNLNNNVKVTNNTLITKGKGYGLIASPFIQSLVIDGNTLDNGISYRTFSNVTSKNKIFKFSNNVIYDKFYFYIKNANLESVIIRDNIYYEGIEKQEVITINEINVENLIIKNNSLGNNFIKNYNPFTCSELNISDNTLNRLELDVNKIRSFSITRNLFLHEGTICIVNNEVLNQLNYSMNKCNSKGSAIKVNNVDISLECNDFINSTGLPYDFGDNVKVVKGFYSGNGAPTKNDGIGVTYRDISGIKNCFYLKTSEEQSGWYLFNNN